MLKKLRSKFMLSSNVLSSPWRHAFTVAFFAPLILNNCVFGDRELESLTQILKKLPEPNYIESSDYTRLMKNYSATLEPRATQTRLNRRASARPTLVNWMAENYGMAKIELPQDNSGFTFDTLDQLRFRFYLMARSHDGSQLVWNGVTEKVHLSLKDLCDNDLNDCPEIDIKARIAMQRAYNFALKISRETDFFLLTMVVRRNDEREVLLTLSRGLPVRIEPMNHAYLAIDKEALVNNETARRELHELTEIYRERPVIADEYAFFVVSTDLWNDDLMTKEIRDYMCLEYRRKLNDPNILDGDDGAEINKQAQKKYSSLTTEIMSTAYWYLRRFFVPPEHNEIRSSMIVIGLLRPIEEICSYIEDRQIQSGQVNAENKLEKNSIIISEKDQNRADVESESGEVHSRP